MRGFLALLLPWIVAGFSLAQSGPKIHSTGSQTLVSKLHGRSLRSVDDSGESDNAEIAKIALPALLSEVVDPFLSIVDTAFAGRLGADALAALGPCVSLFHLSFNTFGSVRGTTTALVASALATEAEGRADTSGCSAAEMATQSLVLSVGVGLVISTLLLTYPGDCALRAMGLGGSSGASVHLLGDARRYLRARAVASPAFLAIMAMEGAPRTRERRAQ